jgi:magnesium chelatase family protein
VICQQKRTALAALWSCNTAGMLACIRSAAVYGIEASTVAIEVDVSFGLPGFTVVGLPDASVRESRDRI